MKIEKTVCPYCGASLKILPGQTNVECEYCGNTSLITDSEVSPQSKSPSEDERPDWYVKTTGNTIPGPNFNSGNNKKKAAGQSSAGKKNMPFKKEAATPVTKHSLLPPPGFRQKNMLYMILAAAGYLFLLAVAFNLDSPLDTVFFLISTFSVIDICTDWTGLYSRLKGLHSPNTGYRILMKIVWSTVVFFGWLFIMAAINVMTGM